LTSGDLFLSPTPLVVERGTVPIGQLLLVGEHHPRTVQDTIGVVLNVLQKKINGAKKPSGSKIRATSDKM
jgi:hypothetical protein